MIVGRYFRGSLVDWMYFRGSLVDIQNRGNSRQEWRTDEFFSYSFLKNVNISKWWFFG